MIRKYIHYARTHIILQWDRKIMEYATTKGLDIIYSTGSNINEAIVMGSIHRLSEASARLRLSETITINDVDLAIAFVSESNMSSIYGISASTPFSLNMKND